MNDIGIYNAYSFLINLQVLKVITVTVFLIKDGSQFFGKQNLIDTLLELINILKLRRGGLMPNMVIENHGMLLLLKFILCIFDGFILILQINHYLLERLMTLERLSIPIIN